MRIASVVIVCMALAGCTPPAPSTSGESAAERETDAAVKRLIAAPPISTAPGFSASLLVPPGAMYDPLTLIPHGDGVWLNDDGREEGERGGRIYAVDKGGKVTVLVDTNRLYPPTGFDIAPAGFGGFAGQIFTVSQPRSTSLGTRRNHVILRVDPSTTDPAHEHCVLPTHGDVEGGVPGGGLDARFGPTGSAFAGRLFAVAIFNATIYQITPDGTCAPFVTLPGQRPFGITFNADGSRFLVATGGAVGQPVPFGVTPPPATGNILAIGPDGVIDPTPVAEGIERPYGLAVAPADFGPFGGQIFYTTGGIAPPVGAPQGRGALYRLGKDGTPVSVATGFFRPTGIAFVGNAIWIADIKGDFIPGRQLPDGTVFRIARD